jgi:hypothetical protein
MKRFQQIIFLFLFAASLPATSQELSAPKPFMTKRIFKDFVNIHMDYPEKDIREKNQGKFVLHFITNSKGEVIQKNILQSVSSGIDSIGMDIFNKILWLPADYSGITGKGESVFTLKFKISKFEKLAKKRGYRHIEIPYRPVDKSYRIYKPKMLDKQPIPFTKPYKNLEELIYSNLEYPETALKQNISGTVKLSFIIEVNGLPSNIHIIDAVGGGCSEEAVSIIENIKWMPGIKEGKAVRSLKIIQITFSINNHRNTDYIPAQNKQGTI